MNNKDVYIYFSPATDTTGRKLADTLNINYTDSGKKGNSIPPKKAKMIIGWGPKTTEDITFPKNTIVLNHPNSVRSNRNKLQALEVMKKGGVNIANFQTTTEKFKLNLPVIGRQKYHQGGKGFWNCPTKTHVNDAINSGAQYLQELIEISDEFRLHVFKDKVLYGVKKVKRTNEEFEKAFIDDEFTRQKKLWVKNNDGEFDEKVALEIIRRQAKNAVIGGPNMMIRSNKMGWKFSRITKYNENLVQEAVKAIKALELDFGAVDCCLDPEGKAYIIEVNTGPGLEGTPFEKYIDAFTGIIANNGVKEINSKAEEKIIDKSDVNVKAKIEAQLLSKQFDKFRKQFDECDDPVTLNALRSVGAAMFGGQ